MLTCGHAPDHPVVTERERDPVVTERERDPVLVVFSEC